MLRFELPAERRLSHEMVIPIRWGDMDAFGHVNNTVYFRYMESARIEWLHATLGRTGGEEGPVVVNAFCNFLRELTYPGDVLVRTFTGQVGRSSVDTYVTMSRTDEPERVHAEGGARVVWVRHAEQKAIALPEALRTALGA